MNTGYSYKRLTKVLVFTLVAAFSILIAGGFAIFKNEAPRPSQIVNQNGTELISKQSLLSGQAVYEKYGLADYGTYLGNGSYLGPDYTAQSLHIYLKGMDQYYAQSLYRKDFKKLNELQQGGIKAQVKKEIKVNRYDAKKQTLTLTAAQTAGLKTLQSYYRKEFINNPEQAGLPASMINQNKTDAFMYKGNKIDQLTSFFFWGAWLSSTNRPDRSFTYTNNWPYDQDAGNVMPAEAMVWTAISVAILVVGIGVIIYFQRRYQFDMESRYLPDSPVDINPDSPITTSQRKVPKYFVIVMLMFLLQILMGELMAHYYVENSFFGLPLQNIWPFNVAKAWHLQLVIFWVATTWLATGIYIVPRVLRREPRNQGKLVDLLFWGLIICVGGSMLGEWGSTLGIINKNWWLFGNSGWEYLELGKFWQIVFILAMILWVVILMRGFIPAMKRKFDYDRTRLTTLLFCGAIAIPAFYLASLFILPNSHVTFADYWRWWIVHLWVEGIFESFAVILIGWLMVDMKLTTVRSTVRALYFQVILLLGSGVVGMGHHYFWEGDHSVWLALGACFSALEIVPLCLLVWEAYTHYRVYKDAQKVFPYKGTFIFLMWTGIWNAVGAGALGFLINAPAINYFEHGTQWTSAHAHASMAGVYGMFSIAIMLYTLRNVTKKSLWTPKMEKAVSWAAWLTNIGLAGMVFITLLPVGQIQLMDALKNGYWHARLLSFYHQPDVAALLWARMAPDLIFTAGVVVLLVIVVKAFFNLKKDDNKGAQQALEKLAVQDEQEDAAELRD
ncbi:nitric-oxide reductase large subunit [Lentilactobacillus parabuchneri]|uniref:nitric-oxide reductase large subunit n=1 Tax=Lentilactobacillus parabuchneri TaxID=152331 RepID=UPI000A111114|nr:cbb3-type cytochrome c oxidase subunit I [Lentilactobacillus parabuchneri]ORM97959.1 Nitric oxide reductase subunit B [Lentilactobacillus parabuchneri]ORN17490.1 Nitric oxide reductase subunit B [Lentilactobacillus parabuchneri]ORN19134.1 Nitric oxide reductase subunit B [Lentilactobacillus parabuchneri]ORN22511.1 Nitric oxide reductase subunit B [Lentilactobacillus parabuchneri]ORN29778.1 Nitric oxide reductase subunit B [Lentilactobacillus parabuchneri]